MAISVPTPGTQQSFSHYHQRHGLMTVTYQVLYVLPKDAWIQDPIDPVTGVMEDAEKLMRLGLRISKVVEWKGHSTSNYDVYLERDLWPHLGEQPCPLCDQRIDGEGK